MLNISSKSMYRNIQGVISLIEHNSDALDQEMLSHLSKYICVRCSGFIEKSVGYIFSDYIDRNCSHLLICKYSKGQLSKLQNVNSEKLIKLCDSFDSSWKEKIKNYGQENNRFESMNYIIKERNNIAHGKDSDITLSKIKMHWIKIVELVDYIESICHE